MERGERSPRVEESVGLIALKADDIAGLGEKI